MDAEFTQLDQKAELISLGLVSDSGMQFYAEKRDIDANRYSEWVRIHVAPNLQWLSLNPRPEQFIDQDESRLTSCFGSSDWICSHLSVWLEQFGDVEVWGDCVAYDWLLFCELWGGAQKIPKNIFYIPYDLATLFRANDIDSDISRESFSGKIGEKKDCGNKHNALHDALIIQMCVNRLLKTYKRENA